MRIQDLEHQVGLDRATIRYYEKEGLITPERAENGYRDYTDKHAEELKKIRLLRQLGMSLHTIRQLQQGSDDFTEILSRQVETLSGQIAETKRARVVCQSMREDGAAFETLDADHYLNLMQTIRVDELDTLHQEFHEQVPREIHPWRRFFARTLDYWLLGVLVDFLIVVVLRVRPVPEGLPDALIVVGTAVLMIPIEAFMLSKWGTTPGKYALGIRLEAAQGGNLSYSAALERAKLVCQYGMAFQIPIVTTVFQVKCYTQLTGRAYRRFTRYDEIEGPVEMMWDQETEIVYAHPEWKQRAVLAALIAVALSIGMLNGQSAVSPKHRGDLTVAEFAENYNFYVDILDENVTRSERMQPDGSWYPESDNAVTIYLNGEPEQREQSLEFETEDGIIRSIHYEQTWKNFFYFDPLPGQCERSILTLFMSRKGNGLWELYALSEIMKEQNFTESGELNIQELLITWKIDTVNCTPTGNQGLVSTSKTQESSVHVEFWITVQPE